MFDGLYLILREIIRDLTQFTVNLINSGIIVAGGANLDDFNFDLKLLSDTPIISIDGLNLACMIFSVFYTIFFIVLLYKATKKFINMIFGVFRV